MCDSISLTADLYELQDRFGITKTMAPVDRRELIQPTCDTVVIVGRNGERRLVEARWGLFPFWAKDSMKADFSALLGKPAFRRMLTKQRCVIPCSSFQAARREGKTHVSARFVPENGGVFALAGLYEERVDSRGEVHRSCTIVTTRPNRLVSAYSDSMPVILDRDATGDWLRPVFEGEDGRLRPFDPYDEAEMRVEPFQ